METVKTFLNNKNNQILVVIAVVILVASVVFFFKRETVDFFSTGLKSFSTEAKDYLLQNDESTGVEGNQDFGAEYGNLKNVEPKDITEPSELLPQTPISLEAQQAFQTDQALVGDNYLNSGALAGINTTHSSLKNANLDIRAAPSIQHDDKVSPWGNSTIESDPTGLVLA